MFTQRTPATGAIGCKKTLFLSTSTPLLSRRRAWVCVAAAVAFFTFAATGASAEHAQLLDPVVWYSDVARSEAKGLAYNSKSGVLYQVGNRWVNSRHWFDMGASSAAIYR